VTIGRVRARWSTLWRSGAVVSALLVAGVVRLMRARRRRRRSAEPGDEA
jgi:hypothetical protein